MRPLKLEIEIKEENEEEDLTRGGRDSGRAARPRINSCLNRKWRLEASSGWEKGMKNASPCPFEDEEQG